MLYDKDIREPLFFFLEERLGRIRIIEEKNMGGSRADVVIVTEEELIGLEIKSDADTYQRLPGQVKDYDQYFDRNIIAVGSHHAEHVAEHVPTHWGIITIDSFQGIFNTNMRAFLKELSQKSFWNRLMRTYLTRKSPHFFLTETIQRFHRH